MEEEWKTIKDYPNYQVSNLGNVKSLDYKGTGKEKIKKSEDNGNGYLRVVLYKNGKGKHYYVHRLVAQAFITNPDNLPQVNHKDENPSNNCVSNLEYCDQKYNNSFGTRIERIVKANINHPNKSKIVVQYDLDGNYINEFPSAREVERQLGFSNQSILYSCNGGYFDKKRNKWANVSQAYGFIWKYKENGDNQ